MPVIALANQKGGVAKTTTTISLGTVWASEGDRVLLVDCDPQAALTYSMGIDPEDLDVSLHDVLVGRASMTDVLWEAHGCHIAAATIDLAGSEAYLLTKTGREFALGRALRTVEDAYDVVLLDCPPSLGILTINALTAADEVIVPLQCETLSLRGMNHLLETIEDVRSFTNPHLRLRGVVATMFDPRTNLGRQVLTNVTESFGLEVIGPPVRKSVRFAEAPAAGETIFQHAPKVPGAEAYREIARILRDWGPDAEAETETSPGALASEAITGERGETQAGPDDQAPQADVDLDLTREPEPAPVGPAPRT